MDNSLYEQLVTILYALHTIEQTKHNRMDLSITSTIPFSDLKFYIKFLFDNDVGVKRNRLNLLLL